MNKLLAKTTKFFIVVIIILTLLTSTTSNNTAEPESKKEEQNNANKIDYDKLIEEELSKYESIENLDMFYSNTKGVPPELLLPKEQLYSLLKRGVTFVSEQAKKKLFKGNFVNFLDVTYKNNLPLFLTADPILYAFNENIRLIYTILSENYAYALAGKFYKEVFKVINQIPNEEIKFSLIEIKKFLAIFFELIKDGVEYEELEFPNDIPQAKYIDILEAIKKHSMYFRVKLFGNDQYMNFSEFNPKSVFTRSRYAYNLYHAIKWFSCYKFNFINNIQVIWILAKAINEANMSDVYIAISKYTKYFLEGHDLQINFKEIYETGQKLGFKSFLLSEDEKASLYNRLIIETYDMFNFTGFDFRSKKPFKKEKTSIISLFPHNEPFNKWFITNTLTKEDKKISSISEYAYAVLDNNSELYILNQRYNTKEFDNYQFFKDRDGVNIMDTLNLLKKAIDESINQHEDLWKKHFNKSYILLLRKLVLNPELKEKGEIDLTDLSLKGFTSLGALAHINYDDTYTSSDFEASFKEGQYSDIVIQPEVEFFDVMLQIVSKFEKIFHYVSEAHKNNPHELNDFLTTKFGKLKSAINLLKLNKSNQVKGIKDAGLEASLKKIISNDGLNYNGWFMDLIEPAEEFTVSQLMQQKFLKYDLNYSPPDFESFEGIVTCEYLRSNIVGYKLVKSSNSKKVRIMLFSNYNPVEVNIPYKVNRSAKSVYSQIEGGN